MQRNINHCVYYIVVTIITSTRSCIDRPEGAKCFGMAIKTICYGNPYLYGFNLHCYTFRSRTQGETLVSVKFL